MIEREPERRETSQFGFKKLKLVTPLLANKVGVQAEAPVFISLKVFGPDVCHQCRVKYNPLVYAVREITRAHHFHKSGLGGGGIYLVTRDSVEATNYELGWLAIVEPLGEISQDERSEAVFVQEIQANCYLHGEHEQLNQGVVIWDSSSLFRSLVPACHFSVETLRLADRVRYDFKITEDGQVLFSQL